MDLNVVNVVVPLVNVKNYKNKYLLFLKYNKSILVKNIPEYKVFYYTKET